LIFSKSKVYLRKSEQDASSLQKVLLNSAKFVHKNENAISNQNALTGHNKYNMI